MTRGNAKFLRDEMERRAKDILRLGMESNDEELATAALFKGTADASEDALTGNDNEVVTVVLKTDEAEHVTYEMDYCAEYLRHVHEEGESLEYGRPALTPAENAEQFEQARDALIVSLGWQHTLKETFGNKQVEISLMREDAQAISTAIEGLLDSGVPLEGHLKRAHNTIRTALKRQHDPAYI